MIKSSDVQGGTSAGGDMTFHANDESAWLTLFRQHMDEMFTYMFRIKEQGGGGGHEFSPFIDIYESLNQYVIEVDLPGFSEDDFTITTSGSSLRIEGVKCQEKHDAGVSYICLERLFGRFLRSVEIPEAFDPDRLQTTFSRGVLSVRISRKQ